MLPELGPVAPVMGFDPTSTRLDKPPSMPTDSTGNCARGEARTRIRRLRTPLLVRSSCSSFGVTRGIEPPHVGHDHAASPVAQRHHRSARQESNLHELGPEPSGLPNIPRAGALPWIRTKLSAFSARRFHQYSLKRGDPFRNRTGLARLKGGHPHQKTNGPEKFWQTTSFAPPARAGADPRSRTARTSLRGRCLPRRTGNGLRGHESNVQ